ncbi:AAA family ATPase [Rhodococcus sp. IEGM 1381]|uniref:AAA family ATPase n=1 Tax=Rhodococcus sp. IEGM 1381 TaxID=3047085 RepID=UPI0024B658F7|nr:AAA family ATPase [Rhodococcus sp. IEGM 1381]MDI9896005.1 AAA family ATPase [Rhodococcus sp. IEGM 1381]
MEDRWDTSNHDVVTAPGFSLTLGEMPVYLSAFLLSEGEIFSSPYDGIRSNIKEVISENQKAKSAAQSPSSEITDQRLRTWKKTFEEAGLVYVDSDTKTINSTRLGSEIRQSIVSIRRQIEGTQDHIASLALQVLSRQTLANPFAPRKYPDHTDIHPFRAVLIAARALENKIHWDEVNRVLIWLLREVDLQPAISRIRQIRPIDGVYTNSLAAKLGPQAEEDRRRITPLLTEAAFGQTFMRDIGDGYWQLQARYIADIDNIISDPVVAPKWALQGRDAYMHYLNDGPSLDIDPSVTQSGGESIAALRDAIENFGDRKFIALSGIPGTGKSRLARQAATLITEGDPHRFMEIQFHEGMGYDNFVEGYVPKTDGTGFELKPMTLLTINDRALNDPAQRLYILLIEEFTRANVHAVLGELLTYIEHRNRSFRLTYSQKETRLAPNLRVIVTMNSKDRSALTLDNAVLRRLHRVQLNPSSVILSEILSGLLIDTDLEKLIRWYETYKQDLPFGHGEFANVRTSEDLESVWSGTLIHFLIGADGLINPIYQDAVEAYPWSEIV